MTSCRYCRYANGTWVKSLQKTTYACREGHDTKAEHCDYFDREPIAIAMDFGSNEKTVIAIVSYSGGEIEEIDNIYEGSIQDTWA